MAYNHKAFSKQRWNAALKAELLMFNQLQHDHEGINAIKEKIKARYLPLIEPYLSNLQEDSEILELGCGPTCISQYIKHGRKTFLDPLLDDFRRAWPGSLPKGTFITSAAESIQATADSYDCIICLKTISCVQNPELVLHEVERILREDGCFIISVDLWPVAFARLHYLTARLFPQSILKNRLYCYTRRGIENTLKRHFIIQSSQRIDTNSAFSIKHERLYICKPLNK